MFYKGAKKPVTAVHGLLHTEYRTMDLTSIQYGTRTKNYEYAFKTLDHIIFLFTISLWLNLMCTTAR